MRISSQLSLCALCALLPLFASARAIRILDESEAVVFQPLTTRSVSQANAELSSDTLDGVEFEARRRPYTSTEGEDPFVEQLGSVQSPSEDTKIVRIFEDGAPDPDNADPESDSDEQDFNSSPTPINRGRWRAVMLGILAAIALTTVLGYHVYLRRERLRELVVQLPPVPFSLTRLKYIQLPTFTLPTLSTPRRTRRRRLRRSKAGFRPHISRHRAWTDTEGGLPYDYDYDGDYERGPGYDDLASPTSSSSDSYAQEAEAFDLGADEDFMIGAPRRSLRSPSSPASATAPGGFSNSVGNVWGRWKRAGGKKGKKGRRSGSASVRTAEGNGGAVLFAVMDGDDDLDLQLETDEALPLAPTPHRFTNVKGYGSAG